MSDSSSNEGIYIILGVLTGIVGKQIHGSILWAIVNAVFWWLSWIKWLIYEEVNISTIKEAFSFFLN